MLTNRCLLSQFGGMDNDKNKTFPGGPKRQIAKHDNHGRNKRQSLARPLFSTAHARNEFRIFVPCLAALILLACWLNLTGLLYALWPVHIIAALPLFVGTLAPRYTARLAGKADTDSGRCTGRCTAPLYNSDTLI